MTIPSPLASSPVATRRNTAAGRAAIPLSIYVVSLASLLTIVGILWDISWHRSIGRDKFLSPPHILVYLGAIFAGLFSGIQVVYNSFFRKEAAKVADIRVWGIFYSPLGSLFCIWGAIAMLTSAPFDDWWHNAYGLDVTILSPPHTLLALGMIFLQFGACVSICKYLNASDPAGGGGRTLLQTLFVISAFSLLTMVYTLFTDYLHIRAMRGRALRMKWGMTAVAAGYFLLVAGSNWILQLFPAEPKLGPILTHITHFQPANFPALVIIPAMAMDLVLRRNRGGDWRRAFWLSLAFVALLVAVQYPLSGFLQESPYARNWFFTANSYYFGLSPNAPWRYKFRPEDIATLPALLRALGIAMILGWVCARISLRWGQWMQTIQR